MTPTEFNIALERIGEENEQARILKQVRKHVSAELADYLADYFRSGRTVDDFKDCIVRATEERDAA